MGEGGGVEGRKAAMREVHGEGVQRVWRANLRDLEYRRSRTAAWSRVPTERDVPKQHDGVLGRICEGGQTWVWCDTTIWGSFAVWPIRAFASASPSVCVSDSVSASAPLPLLFPLYVRI